MYVVVNKSNEISLYETWDECHKAVNGVKGNKGYKKIKDRQSLFEFVSGKTGFSVEQIEVLVDISKFPQKDSLNNQEIPTKSDNDTTAEDNFPDILTIYVDGSFNNKTGAYGYGLVAVKNGTVLKEIAEAGHDQEFATQRNVAGEIMGAMMAVEYAKTMDADEIVICYDYKGIELWAVDDSYEGIRSHSSEKPWKANNNYTQEYKACMLDDQKYMKIHFKKIKAHSGDKYNDMADMLAKKAVGLA